MSNNETGGPAFPLHPEVSKSHFDTTDAYVGMTLRDYFAAKAMQGDLANSEGGFLSLNASLEQLETNAALFYRMADAMLKARQQ